MKLIKTILIKAPPSWGFLFLDIQDWRDGNKGIWDFYQLVLIFELFNYINERFNDAWTDLFNALGKSLVVGGQLSDRSKAITEAGSYVKLTYFSLNVDTGKKTFIAKNLTILKVE